MIQLHQVYLSDQWTWFEKLSWLSFIWQRHSVRWSHQKGISFLKSRLCTEFHEENLTRSFLTDQRRQSKTINQAGISDIDKESGDIQSTCDSITSPPFQISCSETRSEIFAGSLYFFLEKFWAISRRLVACRETKKWLNISRKKDLFPSPLPPPPPNTFQEKHIKRRKNKSVFTEKQPEAVHYSWNSGLWNAPPNGENGTMEEGGSPPLYVNLDWGLLLLMRPNIKGEGERGGLSCSPIDLAEIKKVLVKQHLRQPPPYGRTKSSIEIVSLIHR